MDNLRHLRTSLPRTPSSRAAAQQQSPEALLSAFKAAALSVTNLYKTAASDQARARAAGYQDALDDLLTFLDKENLGLGVDGEGWRVRQWATERFDGSSRAGDVRGDDDSADEDEADHQAQHQRSSEEEQQQQYQHEQQQQQQRRRTASESPEVVRKREEELERTAEREAEEAPREPGGARMEVTTVPQQDMFTFRSSMAYPSSNNSSNSNEERDTDMDGLMRSVESGEQGQSQPQLQQQAQQQQPQQQQPPIHVSVLPRQRANRHRTTSNRNSSLNLNLGSLGQGAGAKRKLPLSDFFDLGNFQGFGKDWNGRDRDGFGSGGGGGGGGGKRGRHA